MLLLNEGVLNEEIYEQKRKKKMKFIKIAVVLKYPHYYHRSSSMRFFIYKTLHNNSSEKFQVFFRVIWKILQKHERKIVVTRNHKLFIFFYRSSIKTYSPSFRTSSGRFNVKNTFICQILSSELSLFTWIRFCLPNTFQVLN